MNKEYRKIQWTPDSPERITLTLDIEAIEERERILKLNKRTNGD